MSLGDKSLQSDVTTLLGKGWIIHKLTDGSEYDLVTTYNQTHLALPLDKESDAMCTNLRKKARKYADKSGAGFDMYAPPLGWGVVFAIKKGTYNQKVAWQQKTLWYETDTDVLWNTDACAEGGDSWVDKLVPIEPSPLPVSETPPEPPPKTPPAEKSNNWWKAAVGLGLAAGLFWLTIYKDKD